jgi:hypothetical protein
LNDRGIEIQEGFCDNDECPEKNIRQTVVSFDTREFGSTSVASIYLCFKCINRAKMIVNEN